MRIAIVNDVPMAVEAIKRVLGGRPEHQVAWVASNGAEAAEHCARDKPDLILMDLVMPEVGGVESTRRIMHDSPCAILLVTASIEGHSGRIFEALGAGALDVVATPILGLDGMAGGAKELLAKIDTIGRLIGAEPARRRASAPAEATSIPAQNGRLLAIGASAGGPAAVATILQGLPKDFPAAVVIVQHVDEQFAPQMASWLDGQSSLRVRVASEGGRPLPGAVLLAGTNDHLVFRDEHTLGYTPEPRKCSYRPSVDAFFESVARHWRGDVVAVILTGMGRDGAKGLKALRDAGAQTIAQDQATCIVYGMPKAAAELGAAMEILPLEKIAPRLVEIVSRSEKGVKPV